MADEIGLDFEKWKMKMEEFLNFNAT